MKIHFDHKNLTCYIISEGCKISYKLLIRLFGWCFDIEREENMDEINMSVIREGEKDERKDSEFGRGWERWNGYEYYQDRLKATRWQPT